MNIDVVHESLKRCNQNPKFLERFYEKFLSASPAIRAQFAETDMKRQQRMVEASLYLSILSADHVPYAEDAINRIGVRHGDLGITPAMYEIWMESLLDTIAECDPAFDDQVGTEWRAILRQSIDRMLAQYAG